MDGTFAVQAAAVLAAGIAMAVGTIGPALGQGMIGTKAMENIGKYPEMAGRIQGAMMLAMIIVETSSVFALVVAILIIARAL